MSRPLQAPPVSRAGLTLLELLVATTVMTVAVTMFTSMVLHTSRQRGLNREGAIAANAARTTVELMRNEEFRDIYPLFNEDSSDDPDGPGTAPGHRFAVPGLTPLASNSDGLVGTITFPVIRQEKEKVAVVWGVVEKSTSLGVIGGIGIGGKGEGGEVSAPLNYFLREDYLDERMGMPRDLNGDSLIDELDHADDYTVLPVHVEIEWRGTFGPRRLDLYTQIALLSKEP